MARSLCCFCARSGIIRALVLVGMALAAACGSDAPQPPGAEDDAGRRIVALVPSLNELIVELGAGEVLAARTDYDTHALAESLPSIGGGLDPNLESLVDLQIDVVLMAAGRDTPELATRMESLGIQVETFQTQTVDDIYESIAHLGVLLRREAAADSLASSIRTELSEVADRVSGQARVPVMFVVWSDPPQTTGGGTFIDEVITIAGGRNVFADAALEWPNVGFETIVARAPSAIIWPQGEYTIANVGELRTRAGWRDVEAVRDGRVILVDANLFNRPGPGVVEAAQMLAAALHPDVH